LRQCETCEQTKLTLERVDRKVPLSGPMREKSSLFTLRVGLTCPRRLVRRVVSCFLCFLSVFVFLMCPTCFLNRDVVFFLSRVNKHARAHKHVSFLHQVAGVVCARLKKLALHRYFMMHNVSLAFSAVTIRLVTVWCASDLFLRLLLLFADLCCCKDLPCGGDSFRALPGWVCDRHLLVLHSQHHHHGALPAQQDSSAKGHKFSRRPSARGEAERELQARGQRQD
jgi:hypothetical protein